MAHNVNISIPNIIKVGNKSNGEQESQNSSNSVLSSESSVTSLSPSTTISSAPTTTTILDTDWQTTKETLREKIAVMFNNELMSDITFIVGSSGHTQKIPAHTFILATGSPVFYAMFYGALAERKQQIEIPDVEPSGFLKLLKYLYCDEIQLESDTVLYTLYVAKKYIVPHLINACINFLITTVTANNVCLLLSLPYLLEEPELTRKCWEVIDGQAQQVLKSDGFIDIDFKTLKVILARETLRCREINIYEAALAWAQEACIRNEMDPTPANIRAMLGDAINLIRFPTLTLEEFSNSVAPSDILTHQENHILFLFFTAANKPSLPYPTKPRTGQKAQICQRFSKISIGGKYSGKTDAIAFTVNKRIFLLGFGLYGSNRTSAKYKVSIELQRDGHILAKNDTNFSSDCSKRCFRVYFKDPILIEAECTYTALATIYGTNSYIGVSGLNRVCIRGVEFNFLCTTKSENFTTTDRGQIPELIFIR